MSGELVFARAGFGASAVPYPDGWALQQRLHERRVSGDIPDTCLLLEHRPVYTVGPSTAFMALATSPRSPVLTV